MIIHPIMMIIDLMFVSLARKSQQCANHSELITYHKHLIKSAIEGNATVEIGTFTRSATFYNFCNEIKEI